MYDVKAVINEAVDIVSKRRGETSEPTLEVVIAVTVTLIQQGILDPDMLLRHYIEVCERVDMNRNDDDSVDELEATE